MKSSRKHSKKHTSSTKRGGKSVPVSATQNRACSDAGSEPALDVAHAQLVSELGHNQIPVLRAYVGAWQPGSGARSE